MVDLLPIGSVVLLKGATKKIMINGYYPAVMLEDGVMIYDYSACCFPEGVIDPNNTMMFNHEQINEVIFLGLTNDEQAEYVKLLKETIKEEQSAFNVENNVEAS